MKSRSKSATAPNQPPAMAHPAPVRNPARRPNRPMSREMGVAVTMALSICREMVKVARLGTGAT